MEKRFGGGGENMDIVKLSNGEINDYDNLIEDSKEGTIFHKGWWLDIFKGYYGDSYKIERYGAFENDNLIAGFPITYFKKYGLRIISSPILTPYLGSFFINKKFEKKYREITFKKEINTKFAEILKEKGICFHYPFNIANVDLQPFIWSGFDSNVLYTYILKLDDLDVIWRAMDRKRRNDITRGYKENYQIILGEISKFIELYKQTMKRQKQKVLPEGILRNIFKECKERNCCEVFTAYKSEEAIASLFLVWDNKRSYYLGGGINRNSYGAMSLIEWEAIKYTKDKLNLNEFDFEGSMVQSIEFYFRKFGGNIIPYYSLSNKGLFQSLISFYGKIRR